MPSETYFRNIVGEPRRIGTRPVYDDDKDLPRPESLDLANPQDEPDFGTLLASWTEQTSVYGTIVKDIFRSKNGKYYYVFYRDSLGRAGISFIETLTEIVSQGVRREWIDLGDLAVPIMEYNSQTGGYGNDAIRKGNYRDMYKKTI